MRLRDEFVAVASHELKTPLTPFALRLQSLAREADLESVDFGAVVRDAAARYGPQQASAEKARLTVQDQGIGIALEHQAMDGTVSVQSEPGHGSTFTVELPL